MHEGGDALTHGEGVESILNISREYFAPDASDHVYRQVVKFAQYKHADQTLGRYLPEFGILRRKAEARVEMGNALPGVSVPIFA